MKKTLKVLMTLFVGCALILVPASALAEVNEPSTCTSIDPNNTYYNYIIQYLQSFADTPSPLSTIVWEKTKEDAQTPSSCQMSEDSLQAQRKTPAPTETWNMETVPNEQVQIETPIPTETWELETVLIEQVQIKTPAPTASTNNLEKPKQDVISQSSPPPAPSPSQASPAIAVDEYAAEVIRLVNIERAAAGLSKLAVDQSLNAAAAIRAVEIQSVFSHTRPDGRDCFTALAEVGAQYNRAGENIAIGQATPAAVVKAWMESPGHRANILNPNFGRIGVASKANSGGSYGGYAWTQFFAN